MSWWEGKATQQQQQWEKVSIIKFYHFSKVFSSNKNFIFCKLIKNDVKVHTHKQEKCLLLFQIKENQLQCRQDENDVSDHVDVVIAAVYDPSPWTEGREDILEQRLWVSPFAHGEEQNPHF